MFSQINSEFNQIYKQKLNTLQFRFFGKIFEKNLICYFKKQNKYECKSHMKSVKQPHAALLSRVGHPFPEDLQFTFFSNLKIY